jgi:hypothetical protein
MWTYAKTVKAYLEELERDYKRYTIEVLRRRIRKHIQRPYVEAMVDGMIGYGLAPHPDAKNQRAAVLVLGLMAHISYFSIYVPFMNIDRKLHRWFEQEWKKTGKRVYMGKAVIRLVSEDELPTELLARLLDKLADPKYRKPPFTSLG